MLELTAEQQAAAEASKAPLFLRNPRTNKTYVLVGAEIYELLRSLLGGDNGLDMSQVATLVDRAMSEDDAGDPTLGFYQQKYGQKP